MRAFYLSHSEGEMPDTNTNGQQQGGATAANNTNGQASDQNAAQQNNQQAAGAPETWDAWLASRPEDERGTITRLYESQTTGLRSALQSEREGRRGLETQIRELQKSAEKGSDNERKLTEMVGALETANRRADFLEAAVKPDVGLSDIEAAWIIVQTKADEYITKRGVDFTLLKERHPGLFKTAPNTPRANAGSGTSNAAPNGADMNAFIRKAAGRN